MSHFTKLKTKLTDSACLLKALNDMGFDNIECTSEAKNLYGYQNDKREQTAEIVLPRRMVGGVSNDIGFKRQEDGTFEAIISDYDRSNRASAKNDITKETRGYNADWLKKLNQRYSYHKVSKELEDLGFEVESVTTENGCIQMECVKVMG